MKRYASEVQNLRTKCVESNNIKLSQISLSGPYWVGCLAGEFYSLETRISYIIYFDPLMHSLSSLAKFVTLYKYLSILEK